MLDNQISIAKTRRCIVMGLGLVMALLVLMVGGPTATASASPVLTFKIEGPWTAKEKTELETDLNPSKPVMKTVLEVTGSPQHNVTVKVVKAEVGHVGEYDPGEHQITMRSLQLPVLVHEIMHATRDGYTLWDSVYEEGLARAGEKEVMRLLALKGITEPGYDVNHEYGYDEYYDANNVFAVGVPEGDIYIESALTLLRYEQVGYAFAKVLMENPQFLIGFNAKVFTHSSGNISPNELAAMAGEVQPEVEGLPYQEWSQQQLIFDVEQPPGCYLFVRVNQFTVDFYSTDQYGNVTALAGAKVKLTITGPFGEKVSNESASTKELGWAEFNPVLSASTGRIKIVATAKCPQTGKAVKTTFYRQSGNPEGIFGVVTNHVITTGTVKISSLSGQSVTVPVENGAFVAPSLGSVRGQFVAEFTSPGKASTRIFNKDAAPYFVSFTAKRAK